MSVNFVKIVLNNLCIVLKLETAEAVVSLTFMVHEDQTSVQNASCVLAIAHHLFLTANPISNYPFSFFFSLKKKQAIRKRDITLKRHENLSMLR